MFCILFSQQSPGEVTSTSGIGVDDVDVDVEVEFPDSELARLDEMINRPRWVVPVLHNGELEILLDAAISLCKKGQHHFCTHIIKPFNKSTKAEKINMQMRAG